VNGTSPDADKVGERDSAADHFFSPIDRMGKHDTVLAELNRAMSYGGNDAAHGSSNLRRGGRIARSASRSES